MLQYLQRRGFRTRQKRGLHIRLAMLLAFAAAWPAAAAHAQSLIPRLVFPKDDMSADDVDRMNAAAGRLYQGRSIGSVERWRNPDTGGAGSVKLLRQFERQNMPCWRLEYLIRLPEPQEAMRHLLVNWCKTPNGEWKMLEYTPPD